MIDTAYLSLQECNEMLQELGNEIMSPMTMMIIGGYCMLNMGVREMTTDIDFIPSESEYRIPLKYQHMINSDILNLADLNISYRTLMSYVSEQKTFGNLLVLVADADLLLAMKFVAIQNRSVMRDRIDLVHLARKANIKRAFAALKKITRTYQDFELFKTDLETEVFMAEAAEMAY